MSLSALVLAARISHGQVTTNVASHGDAIVMNDFDADDTHGKCSPDKACTLT
ncbi:hypothetical protein C8F04DRAFT_1249282 [Mycena alexandri]|uniref:Uncharacterized protein n=1 Tax=Mycena alexandri TaxID=1745969 RepID=A0AAD6TIG5_9AGAR|nr:hypothetical protein C8F04DRAFT_1249282 [Mycena alexandri]